MAEFLDQNELHKFKKRLIEYFTLKHSNRIVRMLNVASIEFQFYSHDNWDGGFDIYDLLVHIPIEIYVEIENEVDEITKDIDLIANKLISGVDRIGGVSIQISDTNSSSANLDQPTLDIIDKLKILLTARATGQTIQPNQEADYKNCRQEILKNKFLIDHLPSFIRLCSDLNEFWHFIKPKFKTYQERRTYIKDELDKLIDLVTKDSNPLHTHALSTLDKLNSASIRPMWIKALKRSVDDPEGAITAAKTFLEDVIKTILNDLGIHYRDDKDDIPKLYSLAAEALQLSPAQHLDNTFKQILNGNISIIMGIATLRNKISDAHASGKRPVKPHKRHAEWVVNMAGGLSTFLVATWEANKSI
ncbi:MAG: abortive infection family protein [Gammaproteobacteria bacterium]